MAEQYQYTDPTRDIVTRLDTGDSIAVGNAADPRWQRVQAWMAAGNTIEPPPDTSAQDTARAAVRQALRTFDFNAAIAANTAAFNQFMADADAATTVPQLRRVVRDMAQAQRRANDDIFKTLRRLANALNLNDQADDAQAQSR